MGSSTPRLDVWAAGDSVYELFVPVFIGSVLGSNPSALCWVGVEGPGLVSERFEPNFAVIRASVGDRFRLVGANFSGPGQLGSVRPLD